MAEGAVGGGGVPVTQIVVGGIRLGLHKHEGLSAEAQAQIRQGNEYVVALAEAWQEFTGIPLGFSGTSIQELGQLLQAASGMSLQELGEFLGILPPRLFEGGPVLITDASDLHVEFDSLADFLGPLAFPLPELLQKLSQLLLHPSRMPGEPCLAPAPLLRDLLDLALGKLGGVIGETVAQVGSTLQELLIPAFIEGKDLSHFIQAILDDPITAALNLVLGQRAKIDCEVAGSLGVAESVIETGIKRLEKALAEALA